MTKCICGAGVVDVVGEKDQRQVGRCTSCGLIRTLNPPEDYLSLYTEGDRYHGERPGHTPYRDRYEHDRKVAQSRWPKLLRRFRLLDVGCSNGGFLRWAVDQGMNAEGLELNPGMAAWTSETTGCRVHTAWDTIEGNFNVITYHDVIEHVPDPRAEISRAARYLAMDGVLVIDTPDADDPRFAQLGMDWHHMKPQEHLWFFTGRQLRKLVEQCGLWVDEIDRPIQGKIVVYARK